MEENNISSYDGVCRLQRTIDGFNVDVTLNWDYEGEVSYILKRDNIELTKDIASSKKCFTFSDQYPYLPGQYIARARVIKPDGKIFPLWSNKIEVYPRILVHPVSGMLAKAVLNRMLDRTDGCCFVHDGNALKSMYLVDLRDWLTDIATRDSSLTNPIETVARVLNAISIDNSCTLILLRSGFAEEYLDPDGLYTPYEPNQLYSIKRANAVLDEMYAYAANARPDAKILDLSRFCFAAAQCGDPLAQTPCDAFLDMAAQAVFTMTNDSSFHPIDKEALYAALKPPEVSDKLGFWRVPEPFLDMALFTLQNAEMNQTRLERLRGRLSKYGFIIAELRKLGEHMCYAIISRDRLTDDGSLPAFFSGYGIIAGRFVMGSGEYTGFSANELEEGIGRFSYLECTEASIVMGTDWNGSEMVFYSEGRAWSAFSTRYHLLLLILAALGVPLKFDSDRIALNMFREYVFSEQVLPPHMPITGVEILPQTHKIVVDPKGVSLVQIWDPLKKIPFNETEYWKLIGEAADEMTEQCRILLACGRFPLIYADISGGLDTRMMLTALSGVKDYANKVYASTFAVPNSKDVDFGARIAEGLGLRYHADDALPPLQYVNRDVSARIYRSYFMGTMNKTRDAHYSACGERIQGECAVLRLTGMFGETYRSFFYNLIDPNNTPSTMDAARAIVGNLRDYSPSLSKQDLYDAMERILSNQRGDVYEKIVEIYVGGRMRTIHGLYAPIIEEKHVFMHIGSKKLLLAARMLDFFQWGRGDAQIDMILLRQPRLAFFPVDGKPHLTKAMQERYPQEYHNYQANPLYKSEGDNGWLSAREQDFKNIAAAQVKTNVGPHAWEWEDEVHRLYYRLIAWDKRFYDILCPGLFDKIADVKSGAFTLKYDTPESFSRKLYAKLTSYVDQIELFANRIFQEESNEKLSH